VRPFCEEQPAAERGEGGGAAGSCRLQQQKELHARSYSSGHMDKLCVRHGPSFDRAANEHRALSGAGVAITDCQCFGTSPYATPGTSCALSTNMASNSVFHRFPLFCRPHMAR